MATHDPRSATETTKLAKSTKIKWMLVFFVVFVLFVPERRPSAVSAQSAQAQSPTQAQQKPVFRGGTHFVRVDAYPATKDGRIIDGLTPADFEITEDGRPQTIESFDYISFPTFTPDAERRDPVSQQAGFDLASDPRYRVFVIVVDMALGNSHAGSMARAQTDLYYIQQPLVRFLDRVLGPRDLYGFLTSRNTAKDLVLGQKTVSVEAQIMDLLRSATVDRDDADEFDHCGCGQAGIQCDALIQRLKALRRLDGTYVALESLVTQLGSLREERKNVIFVSNALPRTRPNPSLVAPRGPTYPKAGITNGKVGIGDYSDSLGGGNERVCAGEFQRLANIDFDRRYLDLTDAATRANVAFYVVTPQGLTSSAADNNLIALANDTDGLAIVNTNDLSRGMQKIADDLSAYYVLGYYTTNTTWDGGLRTIKVKLKRSGETIRARRQYRAPTEAEIAALAKAPARTASPATAAAGPRVLVGEPAAFRVAPRQRPENAPRLEFTRTDRLRVEFPILSPLDRRDARMLDSAGKPLPIDVPISEDTAANTIVVELPLAAFGKGVYSIELTAGAGDKTEQCRLTFTVK